jgi:hypothetical protein
MSMSSEQVGNSGDRGSETATEERTLNRYSAPEGNDFAVGNPGGGAPKGNQNPAKHHVYSVPSNLTEHLSDEDLGFIRDLSEAYIESAPFGPEDPRSERILITCIKVWQEHAAEAQIAKEGLSEDVTVGIGQDGTPITEADSHHLRRAANQLNKEVRLTLKDLGLMNSAEKQQAEATESLATILAGENDG